MSLRLVGVCSALVVAGLVTVSTDAVARGSRREIAGYELVKLDRMRANPSAFIGKRVSFDCFFAGLGRIYQPFQTPFVPEQFLNLHVWAPGTSLWDNRDRKDAYLFCYIPRDFEKLVDYAMRLEQYETIRFFGRVTVVYSKQPWFEVEDIEPSAMPRFTDNALKHILVGIKSIRNEDFSMAQASFREALVAGLPQEAETFVQRELGRAYYELEMYGEAADALEKAARIVDDDAWIMLRWGQSISRASDSDDNPAKNLAKARAKLEKARKREPANPEVHAEIGWVIAKEGNPHGGILHVRRAIALHQSAPSYRILGKIYLDLTPPKFGEAENAYQRAIMLDPSNPRYHRELASIYMLQQKYREAEAEYTNVVTLTSAETRGYIDRAQARRKRSNAEGAIQDYEAALRIDTESLDALLGLAATYVEGAKYDSARPILNNAAALAPDSVDVLVELGKVHLAKEDYGSAVVAFQEIIDKRRKDRNADLVEVYYNLGLSKTLKTPPDRSALADFQKVIKSEPKHLGALTMISRVYAEMGKHSSAIKYLATAVDLAPMDEILRLRYAESLAESNQVDDSLKALTALLIDKPDSAHAKNYKAFLISEFKPARIGEALELAEEAQAANEANASFQDTLAWARYKNGQADIARDLLEAAVLTAKDSYAYYHLAVLLQEADPEAAVANITEAKRLLDRLPQSGHVTGTVRSGIMKLAKKLGVN